MIQELSNIHYKRYFFSVNDSFLSAKTRLDADINYFIQSPENVNGGLTEFYTVLINLEESVEKIKANLYHRTASEINSFLSNQIFEHKIIYEIQLEELKKFISLYDTFAQRKKIKKAEKFRLEAYNQNKILAISYIKQNNELLCINFYRLTKKRATNLYSFSRSNSVFNGTHMGRAHRALHWLDIIEFKSKKINFYDFCGWYPGTTDKNLLNINKFKEQFSQTIVKEYSGVIYKNKLLVFLLKIFK